MTDHPVPTAEPTQLRGSRPTFYTADIVVALKHRDRVREVLTECGVPHERKADSDLLGLALLCLTTSTKVAADQVIKRIQDERLRDEADEAATHLDRLLRGLRLYFREKNVGWTPTLGKNRLVGHVTGGGRISHGGDHAPTAVTEYAPEQRTHGKGQGVRVGVLDTGLWSNDWLLGGWTADRRDVRTEKRGLRAVAGHATFVTGLVLRQAPSCQVVAAGVLDEFGEAELWDVAVAIAEMGRAGVDVLNLSMVCYTEDGDPPLALATAIDGLPASMVVVAAAGNHGAWKSRAYEPVIDDAALDLVEPDAVAAAGELEKRTQIERREPAFPAALDRVVAVGAAVDASSAADFTPPDVPWIDVWCPGVRIVSTFLQGEVDVRIADPRSEGYQPHPEPFDSGFARWSGSSFSAALLSGAIAAGIGPDRPTALESWRTIQRNAASAQQLGERPGPPFVDLRGFEPPE